MCLCYDKANQRTKTVSRSQVNGRRICNGIEPSLTFAVLFSSEAPPIIFREIHVIIIQCFTLSGQYWQMRAKQTQGQNWSAISWWKVSKIAAFKTQQHDFFCVGVQKSKDIFTTLAVTRMMRKPPWLNCAEAISFAVKKQQLHNSLQHSLSQYNKRG